MDKRATVDTLHAGLPYLLRSSEVTIVDGDGDGQLDHSALLPAVERLDGPAQGFWQLTRGA